MLKTESEFSGRHSIEANEPDLVVLNQDMSLDFRKFMPIFKSVNMEVVIESIKFHNKVSFRT